VESSNVRGGEGRSEGLRADDATIPPCCGHSHGPHRRRRVLLPIALLLATGVSTFWTGAVGWDPAAYLGSLEEGGRVLVQGWHQGPWHAAVVHAGATVTRSWNVPRGLLYMAAVLAVLLTHEMGHFLMALRHRIPASLPFFIPVPVLPFGTLGAVIGLEGSRADRRQMFDIGVAGPLAGLLIAVPAACIGILQLDPAIQPVGDFRFHNPLIFRLLTELLRPDYPTPASFCLHQFNPMLMAGWVGILVTGLNMLPVSQLDGGHVSYALMGRGAHRLARGLVVAAIAAIVIWEA
jgi:Zn-dependent protease